MTFCTEGKTEGGMTIKTLNKKKLSSVCFPKMLRITVALRFKKSMSYVFVVCIDAVVIINCVVTGYCFGRHK